MAEYVVVVERASCPACQRTRTTWTVVEVGKPRDVTDDPARCEHVFDRGCCNFIRREVSVRG